MKKPSLSWVLEFSLGLFYDQTTPSQLLSEVVVVVVVLNINIIFVCCA